jgi:hypothetical protein
LQRQTWIVIAAAVLATTPLAGAVVAAPIGAEACATHLAPPGRLMFQAVAEHVRANTDIPALMREYVRPLVMSGRISRDDAKQNAQPAGRCLLLLK